MSSVPLALDPNIVDGIYYPETDGLPMAENTRQFEWIVTIKCGLEAVFKDDPNVFIAGDLFWYPVKGEPSIRVAPDTMVAIGRPKGHRRSYKQWLEGDVAPQVVFEVLSPGNTATEMILKGNFYTRFGVEEYYLYDPDELVLLGYLRNGDALQEIPLMSGWISPRLNIRFRLNDEGLQLYGPDGKPFRTYLEIVDERDAAVSERDAAVSERDTALAERDAAIARGERLQERLRELGVDPESL